MTKILTLTLALLSTLTFAAPPRGGPGRWEAMDPDDRAERQEERARAARMMLLVAVAEALELSDAQALKLADKLKAVEEKRRPVREAMGEAMRQVKAAADGDAAALTSLDQNVQRVLDGRVQMAQLDKELFAMLSEGQPAVKKARLALVLAKVGDRMRGHKGRHGRD